MTNAINDTPKRSRGRPRKDEVSAVSQKDASPSKQKEATSAPPAATTTKKTVAKKTAPTKKTAAKKSVSVKKEQTEEAAKERALQAARAEAEKQFGKGAIMKLSDKPLVMDTIPTGALSLDLATGIGGIPRGRITEIFGPESAGKSTLCIHIVAEAQKQGENVLYIDAEHAMDPIYAKAIGMDIDRMDFAQPDTGEQALQITDIFARSGGVSLIIIDSIAALTPEAELAGEIGDKHVGLQARMMAQALRKLTATLSTNNTALVCINQLRDKIKTGYGASYGPTEDTPGGRALKFYSSLRLDIRRVESIKKVTEVIGAKTKVKVVKNKCAPPFKVCDFDIMYGEGINKYASLLDVAVLYGVINKTGKTNYEVWDGTVLTNSGRPNAIEALKADSELYDTIANKLHEHIHGEDGIIEDGFVISSVEPEEDNDENLTEDQLEVELSKVNNLSYNSVIVEENA